MKVYEMVAEGRLTPPQGASLDGLLESFMRMGLQKNKLSSKGIIGLHGSDQ